MEGAGGGGAAGGNRVGFPGNSILEIFPAGFGEVSPAWSNPAVVEALMGVRIQTISTDI